MSRYTRRLQIGWLKFRIRRLYHHYAEIVDDSPAGATLTRHMTSAGVLWMEIERLMSRAFALEKGLD